jgi:hypothetical protein
MPTTPLNSAELLDVLGRHGAETIVVGAVAAVMAGAPLATFDLDLVFRRDEENLDRLLAALAELGAIYRDPAGRRILPSRERLMSMRLHLLDTPFGGLDLLTTIGPDLGYEDLLASATTVMVRGRPIRVLALQKVIATKEFANRPKDRAVLGLLRETLRLNEVRERK